MCTEQRDGRYKRVDECRVELVAMIPSYWCYHYSLQLPYIISTVYIVVVIYICIECYVYIEYAPGFKSMYICVCSFHRHINKKGKHPPRRTYLSIGELKNTDSI